MGRRHSYLHLDSKYVLENLQAQAENCFRGRAATPKAVSGGTVGLRSRWYYQHRDTSLEKVEA